MGLLDTLLTPERRQQAQKEQKEMREKFGARLVQHPAHANYLFGMAREQRALDQLAALSDMVVDEASGPPETEIAAFNQLAEGLALQGRFEEAAKIAASEPHKAEYLAKAEALKYLGVGCQCPPMVTKPSPTDAKGVTMSTQQKVEEVFDGTAVIALTKCMLCGKFAAQIG